MITIEQANALHLPLPDESVDCIVTSPPYLGLRDYGLEPADWPEVSWVPMAGVPAVVTPAQSACLGLETDVMAYVGHMVLVARELARVLKRSGTMWLNLGDTYASAPSWGQGATGRLAGRAIVTARHGADCDPKRGTAAVGQPKKRNGGRVPRKNLLGIPWRVALALQADGWYLRNEIIWRKKNPLPESCRDRATVSHEHLFLLTRRPRYYFNQEAWLEPCSPNTHARVSQDVMAQAGSVTPGKNNGPMKAVVRQKFPSSWDPITHDTIAHNKGQRKMAQPGQGIRNNTSFEIVTGSAQQGRPTRNPEPGTQNGPLLRNRRTVWDISSSPTSDNHFASFPEALVEPCILAGCPPHGVVLDPFCGRGTTLKVANRMDRHGYGYDLSAEYVQLARRNVIPDTLTGMFAKKQLVVGGL